MWQVMLARIMVQQPYLFVTSFKIHFSFWHESVAYPSFKLLKYLLLVSAEKHVLSYFTLLANPSIANALFILVWDVEIPLEIFDLGAS